MLVKFRLCLDTKGNRVTNIYLVDENGSLDLVTQIPGWTGIDFSSISEEDATKVADSITDKVNDSKYIG